MAFNPRNQLLSSSSPCSFNCKFAFVSSEWEAEWNGHFGVGFEIPGRSAGTGQRLTAVTAAHVTQGHGAQYHAPPSTRVSCSIIRYE
eukprot:2374537-Rhodomonas_salina.6